MPHAMIRVDMGLVFELSSLKRELIRAMYLYHGWVKMRHLVRREVHYDDMWARFKSALFIREQRCPCHMLG